MAHQNGLKALLLERPAGSPTHLLRAKIGLPADKAYEQTIESSTSYWRQVRLSARGYRGANLPRAVSSGYNDATLH